MIILKVCVGSACHVRGSYNVIETLTKVIGEERLEDRVELKACFCLNNCLEGVSASIEGDDRIHSFSKEGIVEEFRALLKEMEI